jgi:cell division protein FtsW (lipid II flippase)
MQKLLTSFINTFWIRAMYAAAVSVVLAAIVMPSPLALVVAAAGGPMVAWICRSTPSSSASSSLKLYIGFVGVFTLMQVLDTVQPHLGWAVVIAAVGSVVVSIARLIISTYGKPNTDQT